MAFLLGLAFGVMFLLSVWELWIHAAMEYGFWSVTLPVAAGALLYIAVQPLLPTFNNEDSTPTQARCLQHRMQHSTTDTSQAGRAQDKGSDAKSGARTNDRRGMHSLIDIFLGPFTCPQS